MSPIESILKFLLSTSRNKSSSFQLEEKLARDGIAHITALFNNMRTLKLKAQPTNAFFATVNQMFGGSSQLPTMLSELYSTI